MPSKIEDAEKPIISNKRQAKREQVQIVAELRVADGPRFRINVLDLSSTGFRIQTANNVAANCKIYLSIPNFQTLQGQVAWNDGEFYGCEFSRPLHSSVHAHLASRFPLLFK